MSFPSRSTHLRSGPLTRTVLRGEPLEQRRLLAGDGGWITLTGFLDYDGDGIRGDYYESYLNELTGFELYQDNGDGVFDPTVDRQQDLDTRGFGDGFKDLDVGLYFAVAPDYQHPNGTPTVLSSPRIKEIELKLPSHGGFYDFGYWWTGTTSISVFSDSNANGVRDEGESLVAGKTEINYQIDDSGRSSTFQVTDGQFLPAWGFDGTEEVYWIGTQRVDGLVATTSEPVTVRYEATVHKEFELGVVQSATIQAVVFSDRTGDGRTEDDRPVQLGRFSDLGVKIKITGEASNGQIVDTTAEVYRDSAVWAEDLLPGQYRVELVSEDEQLSLFSNEPLSRDLSVTVGETVYVDFSVFFAEPIEGQVGFSGLHGPSFAGIYVELFRDNGDELFDPRVDTLLESYLTAPEPTYAFSNPGPGSYFLATRLGGQYTPAEIKNAEMYVAESQQNPDSPSFPRSRIWGEVYVDANRNDRFEPRERGLLGVNLTLEGVDVFGNAFSQSTTTAGYGQGRYVFRDLLPGTYSITQEQPAENETGTQTVGDFGGNASTNRFDNIRVETGETGYGYSFSEYGESNLREPRPGYEKDVGVFDPQTSFAYLKREYDSARTWAAYQFGPAGSQAVVGDWNSNSYDAVGVFESRSGLFRLKNQNRNSAEADDLEPFIYGDSGFVAIAGDWNSDGMDSVGVYDPTTSSFYLRNSNDSGISDAGQFTFGRPGWVPLAGDWDGDGYDGVGVYDPETATFYLRNTLTAGAPEVEPFNYGMPGWKPFAGDWNDDAIVTVGVYNPDTATFFLKNSNTSGEADTAPFNYGLAGWEPIVGDWNTSYAALTRPIRINGGVIVFDGDAGRVRHVAYLNDYLRADSAGLDDAELGPLSSNSPASVGGLLQIDQIALQDTAPTLNLQSTSLPNTYTPRGDVSSAPEATIESLDFELPPGLLEELALSQISQSD